MELVTLWFKRATGAEGEWTYSHYEYGHAQYETPVLSEIDEEVHRGFNAIEWSKKHSNMDESYEFETEVNH